MENGLSLQTILAKKQVRSKKYEVRIENKIQYF